MANWTEDIVLFYCHSFNINRLYHVDEIHFLQKHVLERQRDILIQINRKHLLRAYITSHRQVGYDKRMN